MKLVVKICLPIFIVGCLHKNQKGWEWRIEKDSYSIVKLGKYPYNINQIKLDEVTPHTGEILEFRKIIEERPELMVKLAHHFYPDEEVRPQDEFNFKYQFTGMHKNEVIIRYFSRNIHPKVYAGYSIQFVLKEGELKSIYLWRAPLE